LILKGFLFHFIHIFLRGPLDICPWNAYIYSMKNIFIFDLDGTVVDSDWRTPRKGNGSVDISKWLDLATAENIAKDGLLPLARFMQKVIAEGDFVIVATARIMTAADKQFLIDNGINPNIIISRSSNEMKKPDADLKWNKLNRLFNLKQFQNKPKIMFDDNGSVLNRMREKGIVALNSVTINRKLAA